MTKEEFRNLKKNDIICPASHNKNRYLLSIFVAKVIEVQKNKSKRIVTFEYMDHKPEPQINQLTESNNQDIILSGWTYHTWDIYYKDTPIQINTRFDWMIEDEE